MFAINKILSFKEEKQIGSLLFQLLSLQFYLFGSFIC